MDKFTTESIKLINEKTEKIIVQEAKIELKSSLTKGQMKFKHNRIKEVYGKEKIVWSC